MGLDMYLNKEHYLMGDSADVQVGNKHINAKTLIEEIGYWRKANSVHNWFVQECADGKDECQKIFVEKEKLQELYKIVCDILTAKESKTPEEAKEVALKKLPPTQGFFFGSYDIDEWYWQDMKQTKEILEDALNDVDNQEPDVISSVYYQASW